MQLTVSLDTNFITYGNVKQLQDSILYQDQHQAYKGKTECYVTQNIIGYHILQFLDSKVSFSEHSYLL
jgi:hypothetical protein